MEAGTRGLLCEEKREWSGSRKLLWIRAPMADLTVVDDGDNYHYNYYYDA